MKEKPFYVWIDSRDRIRESRQPPSKDSDGKIITFARAYSLLAQYLITLNYWHYVGGKEGEVA